MFFKIVKLEIFLLVSLVFLLILIFYFTKFKKIIKKNKKYLLKFERKKLLINLGLELILLISVFLLILSKLGLMIQTTEKEKIYLFLIDISGSMEANDFKPTRLDVAKNITKEFILKNEGLFGVIAFNDVPLLINYPTRKKEEIIEKLDKLKAEGGTNIGDSLKMAYSILENLKGEKYIILLSDGTPTTGINPLVIIKKEIPIFTVAIGSQDIILGYDNFGRPLIAKVDKDLLKKIALISNGKFFEANEVEDLIKAYKEIERISKEKDYKDISDYLVNIAIILLIIYVFSRNILSLLP